MSKPEATEPVLKPYAVRVRVGFERVYFIAAEDAATAVSQVEAFPGFRERLESLAKDPSEYLSFETMQGREAVALSPAVTEADFVRVYDTMFPEA